MEVVLLTPAVAADADVDASGAAVEDALVGIELFGGCGRKFPALCRMGR